MNLDNPVVLLKALDLETQKALKTVYQLNPPTPLDPLRISPQQTIYLKREDHSPIHAYKWRGAFHALQALSRKEKKHGVVATSRGNHAQGIALAALKLGIDATIFMPEDTVKTKVNAVKSLGKKRVQVILEGQCLEAAYQKGLEYAAETKRCFVHPFDNLLVMAGQGTLGVEMATHLKEREVVPEIAYLQIGGGGMTASVALQLKKQFPKIKIVGVEAKGQACMKAAFLNQGPITLNELNSFCDGTSVRRAGEKAFKLCRILLDDLVTVSNEEVCEAIERLWEERRFIAEPSGALGFAGFLKQTLQNKTAKNVITVITGANMDFSQLSQIATPQKAQGPRNLGGFAVDHEGIHGMSK